jgi:hypothetical protein
MHTPLVCSVIDTIGLCGCDNSSVAAWGVGEPRVSVIGVMLGGRFSAVRQGSEGDAGIETIMIESGNSYRRPDDRGRVEV